MTFTPASDRLWRHASTPFCAAFATLGVRLEIETNALEVLERARNVLGPPIDRQVSTGLDGPVTLRVFVHDPVAEPREPRAAGSCPRVISRSQREYLFVSAGPSFGFVDGAAGFGAAYVTPECMRCGRRLEDVFFECLGVFLASRQGRCTLHAAGLVVGARTLLLTGPAGSGKSTLAYACVRGGFGLLAEDVVFVQQRGRSIRAWGVPWRIHLLPDAVQLFPELEGAVQELRLNGEAKLPVEVERPVTNSTSLDRGACGVLVLRRADGAGSCISPANPADVIAVLVRFDGDPILNTAEMARAARALAAGKIATLHVGCDLNRAVDCARSWLVEEG